MSRLGIQPENKQSRWKKAAERDRKKKQKAAQSNWFLNQRTGRIMRRWSGQWIDEEQWWENMEQIARKWYKENLGYDPTKTIAYDEMMWRFKYQFPEYG